jgi:hypothetical protein
MDRGRQAYTAMAIMLMAMMGKQTKPRIHMAVKVE